jgi:hypothetical protein
MRIEINHRSRNNYSINIHLRDFGLLIENLKIKVLKPHLIINHHKRLGIYDQGRGLCYQEIEHIYFF